MLASFPECLNMVFYRNTMSLPIMIRRLYCLCKCFETKYEKQIVYPSIFKHSRTTQCHRGVLSGKLLLWKTRRGLPFDVRWSCIQKTVSTCNITTYPPCHLLCQMLPFEYAESYSGKKNNSITESHSNAISTLNQRKSSSNAVS